jgi:hypothetical protein
MRKRATLNHGIQKQLEKLKKRLKKATQKTVHYHQKTGLQNSMRFLEAGLIVVV